MTDTATLRARIAQGFDRTLDAVDDLGWNSDGQEPVDVPTEDGTLIEVPPGEYLVDECCDASGLQNWGIRGTGDDKGDVRLVIPEGTAQRVFNIRGNSRNILVENLTFDQFDTWATCIGNVFQVADGLVVRDVEYAGKTPSEYTGGVSRCNVYVFDADGEAVFDNLTMAGPTELVDYPDNPMAFYVGAESEGTVWFRNSHLENTGSSGIYASRCKSDVRVEDSTFKNIQNTFVRISGEGSWATGCRFVWDVDDHPNKGSFQNTTGLTFEAGYRGYASALVEDCEFEVISSGPSSGVIKVDGSHGGATIRDCHLQVDDDDIEPIWVDAPGDSHMIDGEPLEPWPIQLEGVTIEGSGGWNEKSWHDPQHRAAVRIDGRDGSEWRGGSISMPNRDGCRFTRGVYRLDGVAIDVGGTEIDTVGATVEREDGTEDTMNEYAHELIVRGTNGVTEYEIDVSGDAGLITTGDLAATPPSDKGIGETVTRHDGGSCTLAGIVASGGGDTFTFDGEVTDVRTTSGADPDVEVDGTELDLEQFRDDGGEDSDESDGSGDDDDGDGESQRTVVVVEADGTKGNVEPVVRFDGEILDEPSGSSHTLYATRGEIAFSTRDGWRQAFVIAGDVVDVACPEGVTVTVDGEVWEEG